MQEKKFNSTIFPLKDKIFRFALRLLNNRQDAEDMTQDVLTKLWHGKDDLGKLKSVEAYAINMTRNRCLDKLRHQDMKLKKAPEIARNYDSGSGDPDRFDTLDSLTKVIQQLPPAQKMVIQLRDIEGYEFNEIVDSLGMDLNSVRVNLSRARKTVRDKLQKLMSYGMERSPQTGR